MCAVGVLFAPPPSYVDCQEIRNPASELKKNTQSGTIKDHCSLQDEYFQESQLQVDHKSLLECHLDDEHECVVERRFVSPSCRSFKSITVFIKAFKMLIKPLSDLLLWRDRFFSTSSDRCIFMVQSFECLLRLLSSHCAESMVLVYPLHSMKVSMISRSDFFLVLLQRRNGKFECDFIVLDDTFLSTPNT